MNMEPCMSLTLTLAVADLDRTEEFYRELLRQPIERLTPLVGHPPLLLLLVGESTLLFRQGSALAATHPALFQDLDRHPKGVGMTLELTYADLGPVSRNLDRIEHHLLYELQDDEHHRRELWLHDPDGYLLILVQEDLFPDRKEPTS
jgi:catechol 2,3-dioxygenase-like lactoylglutathione lyase family enzyme